MKFTDRESLTASEASCRRIYRSVNRQFQGARLAVAPGQNSDRVPGAESRATPDRLGSVNAPPDLPQIVRVFLDLRSISSGFGSAGFGGLLLGSLSLGDFICSGSTGGPPGRLTWIKDPAPSLALTVL